VDPLGTLKDAPRAVSRAAVARWALAVAAGPVLASVVGIGLLWGRDMRDQRVALELAQASSLAVAASETRDYLARVELDLRYLAEAAPTRDWAEAGDEESREMLEEDLLSFMKNRPRYGRVRIIGVDGREVVRVERGAGGEVGVPAAEGLDEAMGPVLAATLALPPGFLSVSPFELGLAHGQVHQPLTPTVRFGVHVDRADGTRVGAVVIELLGQSLLDLVSAQARRGPGALWLVDAKGRWLLGPPGTRSFTFMWPDQPEQGLMDLDAQAWERLRAGVPEAAFHTTQATVMARRIEPAAAPSPLPAGPSPALRSTEGWLLVAELPDALVLARQQQHSRRWAGVLLSVLALIGGAAWMVSSQELRRRTAEAWLRSSHERLRGLLRAAPDAAFITDEQGNIRYASDRAQGTFGYAAAELQGQPLTLLLPAGWRGVGPSARPGPKPDPPEEPARSHPQARRKDGSQLPVSVSLAPIQTDQGTLVFCALRDVTGEQQQEQEILALNARLANKVVALSELNERLRQQAGRLEQTNEELESFSYSVSHDLRAPLRGVDGFSRVLLERYGDQLGDEGRDYLQRVRAAAQRMGSLIDDLFQLSQTTRAPFQPRSVDLSSLAEVIAAELGAQDPQRAVTWQIAPALQATCDPALLRVVLENLLGNAWKYTGRKATARIEVGQVDTPHGAAFFVRDDGAGFDMAYCDKLFRPFERLHGQTEFPGTGIGLALVRRVILRHQGRVWAEGAVGQGATFYFTIAAPDEAVPASADASTEPEPPDA